MASQLLGGIGLFLLGVFLLADGLKLAAGDALRRILLRFTGQPATAFISGVGITVLAQSSSATTLATIGFVSAGILTFSQAIGIVLGASLGTTSTGWLIALVGMKFGIGKLAFPLVGLGALARLVSNGRNAAIALAVAGFGLMFVGIDILQSGMVGLSASFSPDSLPQGTLTGRVLLVGIGIGLTVITQSSAAAVAMTFTAFHSGMIDLEQGASLIIGASIGTTSTSALAAIRATTPVKRTALAHILFSVAAGILAFAILPAFVWSVKQVGPGLSSQLGVVLLAVFHSGFMLLAALLVLPGVRCFSAFIERLVPERGPALTRNLDSSLIEIPEVAIEAVRRTLRDVAENILAEIERGLHDPMPPAPDRMAAAVAALKEAKHFLGKISFPTSSPDQLNTRVTTIHALDHLSQLSVAAASGFPSTLLSSDQRLQMPMRIVLEMIETAAATLRSPALEPECAKLQQLSLALAERRRTERGTLLEESAHGMVEPEQAMNTLDGLRWLDAVGYHLWRMLHHLATRAGDMDPGKIVARHETEFAQD